MNKAYAGKSIRSYKALITAIKTNSYILRYCDKRGLFYTPLGCLHSQHAQFIFNLGYFAETPYAGIYKWASKEKAIELDQKLQAFAKQFVGFSTDEDKIHLWYMRTKNIKTPVARMRGQDYANRLVTQQTKQVIHAIKPTEKELEINCYIDKHVDITHNYFPPFVSKKQKKETKEIDNSKLVQDFFSQK